MLGFNILQRDQGPAWWGTVISDNGKLTYGMIYIKKQMNNNINSYNEKCPQ